MINFLTQIDYDHMEKRAKHYMKKADREADVLSVWYTIPATTAEEQRRLMDNDLEAYDRLEFHQDGEVIHRWSEMRTYLTSNEPTSVYKVYKDYSQELFGSGFCDYAYILNFDSQELEIYERGNHYPHQAGRYVRALEAIPATVEDGLQEELEQTVAKNCGVRLILSVPLAVLREMTVDERKIFTNLVHQLLLLQAERRTSEETSTGSGRVDSPHAVRSKT